MIRKEHSNVDKIGSALSSKYLEKQYAIRITEHSTRNVLYRYMPTLSRLVRMIARSDRRNNVR